MDKVSDAVDPELALATSPFVEPVVQESECENCGREDEHKIEDCDKEAEDKIEDCDKEYEMNDKKDKGEHRLADCDRVNGIQNGITGVPLKPSDDGGLKDAEEISDMILTKPNALSYTNLTPPTKRILYESDITV